jgi:hypothetical protein
MLVAAWKDFQRPAIYSPDAHEIRLIPTLAVRIAPHPRWSGKTGSHASGVKMFNGRTATGVWAGHCCDRVESQAACPAENREEFP